MTSHDLQAAVYTEIWIDPEQKLKQEARTRKRLAIEQMRQQIQELQQQISSLETELES